MRRNFPAKEAGKITKGKTTVLEKAKVIYDWTCENMYRDPDTRGCGPGKVCLLLKKTRWKMYRYPFCLRFPLPGRRHSRP
jgi:hypothetical protein